MYGEKLNPLDRITDDQILDMVADQATFEKGIKFLLLKYQEKVYWHIRRMTDNHEDTNDIVQNTFIKVFKNIHDFKGKSKLFTWLFRIATNETLSFLKKQKRLSAVVVNNPDSGWLEQPAFQDVMNEEEIIARLENALKILPDKQRLVFNMRYYEEMSYQEISEILGTSIGALKASYHLAAKKIEDSLRKSL